MNMFKRMIAGAAMALMVVTASAGTTNLDTSGLSEAQVAELKAHAAKVVADAAKQADGTGVIAAAAANPGAAVTLAATWGQQAAAAAEGFAKALGIAAKELGLTINDFLHTDAGKLTAALIIWKVAGAGVAKILYALLFVTVGMFITRMIYLRLFTKGYEKVEYSRFGGFFKGTKLIRIPKGFHDLENDGEWLAFWVMIVACLGSLLIGAIII
jgi:hypothetical protein